MASEDDEDDLFMPGLLPAGQVGSLEDSSDDDDDDPPPGLLDIATDDDEDEDEGEERDNDFDKIPGGDGDGDNGPPGLYPTDDESDDEYEEPVSSRYCLTCVSQCECTVELSSSAEDLLLLGQVSTPSSALKKGKRQLEDIMDRAFTHEVWKYGRIANPHGTDSGDEDNDEKDQNVPFDLNSLSRPEIKKRLCADLQLHNNPILDAEPAQRDRLQELVTNYHHIFTDGMSYKAGRMPSVPFISTHVVLDPKTGTHTPHQRWTSCLKA